MRRELAGELMRVDLRGAIDENADLDRVFVDLPASVEFGFRQIDRFNSIGVNRWVPRIATCVRERSTRVAALSYPVVFQANCVSNLFGGATIVSCMAPYFCERCEERFEELIDADEVRRSDGAPPPRACRTCRGELVFDELDRYFALFGP
jgi:hypothetical protein